MLFSKLWRALKMGGRMLKNQLLRPFRALSFGIKRNANLSRQMVKAAPKAAKSIKKVKMKPASREDYVETKGAYVAKSFFIVVVLGIAALVALVLLVAVPLLQKYVFVTHIPVSATEAASHTGRAILYYDDAKTQPYLSARLENGAATGEGISYYQDGTVRYSGSFEGGAYAGKGKLYSEQAVLVYEGEFKGGKYSGQGTLYENGARVYQGGFENGKYNGQGEEYFNGDVLLYAGGYQDGVRSGYAKVYSQEGVMLYEGGYQGDSYSGDGKRYAQNGALESQGTFSGGMLTGRGSQYFENGVLKYRGMFDLDLYEGEGTLYDEFGSMLYKGAFSGGQFEGAGTLYYPSGKKQIVGDFSGGQADGDNIEVYNEQGALIYQGGYSAGAYNGAGKLVYGNGSWIEAMFTNGAPAGAVKLYVNSMLYYEGGYVNGQFSGAGKLYNALGEALYTGNFAYGMPDCAALHGKPVEYIYQLFGEGNYSVYEKKDGILIVNNRYQMAAFVCFSGPETESVVHRVYCYDSVLLSPYTLSTFPFPPIDGKERTGRGRSVAIDGVPGMDSSSAAERRFSAKNYYVTLWGSDETSPVRLVEYKSATPLPATTAETHAQAEAEKAGITTTEEEDEKKPKETKPAA